jgi:hypothetical protein
MSASASSVSITSMSCSGSTLPETCTTLSSAKQRTTCTMASVSRMLARNWLPRPSPLLAPATRPAMSTNSTMAGWIFCGLTMAGQRSEARVGHFDDADVRLDGAEGIVLRRDAGLGQGVEEGGLADVGQADDAAFEAHAGSLLFRMAWALPVWNWQTCVAALNSAPFPATARASRARSMAASISSLLFAPRRLQHKIHHFIAIAG